MWLQELKLLPGEFFEEILQRIQFHLIRGKRSILCEVVDEHSELLCHVERLHEGVHVAGVAQVFQAAVAIAGLSQALPALIALFQTHFSDDVLIVEIVDVCCLQLDLGERLHLAEELFGGIAEAGEAVLVGRVYLNNVFVAGRDGNVFLQSMLTDVNGHFVDLLALETLAVAEADHEVLYDLEVLDELVSRPQSQPSELLPYETTEDMKQNVELTEIYHHVPYSNQQRHDQTG